MANGEEKYALYNVPTASYCLDAKGYITFEHWQEWSYVSCSDAYHPNQTCIEQHETMTQTLDRYGWLAKGLGWFKSVNGSPTYDGRYSWNW